MRLTILGATGRTGALLLRQAVERGDDVTAVVRDRARLSVRDERLKVAEVPDLADVEALRRSLDGAEAVLSGIGARSRKEVPVAAPATRHLLRALDAPGLTRRVVVISAAPVGPPPEDDTLLNRAVMMPLIGAALRPIYDDLGAMEEALAGSGTEWTALRPPRLTDAAPKGHYRTRIGARVPGGTFLSRADLAHGMLACLHRPDTVGQPVGIAD
jgi:putative NADH-flavin reductase